MLTHLNARGTEMNQEILLHDMIILSNRDIPTLFNKSTKKFGSPDLIVASTQPKEELVNWRLGDDVGSDHDKPIKSITNGHKS
jgi:hypothetical protein